MGIGGYCRFLDAQFEAAFHLDGAGGFLHFDYFAVDAANRDNFLAFCQSFPVFLLVFLLFNLWADKKEIENHEN